MPSGAKKRKAAKKKAQKEAHHNNNNNYGSHLQGIDEAKSHDERDSDGGEGERESSEERAVSEEGGNGVNLGDQNVSEFSKEAKLEENYGDAVVNVEDDVRVTKNGGHKGSSSSSSSSSGSSDDDEVAVEEENPVVSEVQSSLPEASRENPVISEAVYGSVEESIPVEESVKQVVSLPQEANTKSDGVAVENLMISHVIESGMNHNLDEVLPSAEEKDKVIQAVDGDPEKLSESVDITAKDGEGLLPQSSGVMSADACCGDDHVKESETHKYVEEQHLISSAPLPVRRTSWMNCCGLFEVFSGEASR